MHFQLGRRRRLKEAMMNIQAKFAAWAMALALGLVARGGEFSPGRIDWRLPAEYARIEGGRLTVEIPKAKYGATAMASATLPASLFKGREGFTLSVAAEAQDVAKPQKPYFGIKSQVHWRETPTGRESWPNTRPASGSFPRTTLKTYVTFAGAKPDLVELQLGLQATSGRIVFDLDTLKFSDEVNFTAKNPDRKVNYPGRVAQDCHRHGVMLPADEPTEDDFRTLQAWGANLVRYQMIRNWHKLRDNSDLGEFNRWLDGKLDILERTVLPLARKYGQKVVVDLHVPPGGRLEGGEMTMFYERQYANAFVACWKRIAARFRGNSDVIYGYDLINEPEQKEPSDCDYWELQRLAAEAVRAIDPDTTIIIESNNWDAPEAFAYLGALDMDNVIYQVHMYSPHEYTHQGVGKANMAPRAYPDRAAGLDIDRLRRYLQPVRDFELRHRAKIYVGEFSAIAWAAGADRYIADCIALFNEYGWDWSYHAFREWGGWSVEHEPGAGGGFVPSPDNPRKRALLNGFSSAQRRPAPYGLTVEYRENPVGIDAARPRFGWKVPAGFGDQVAYEIEADGWRTGRVASREQLGVAWGGSPLGTAARVNWRVRVWNAKGEASAWSDQARFSMGVMDPADWTAQWIAADPATRPEIDLGAANWVLSKSTNVFRKTFMLAAAPKGACDFIWAAKDKYDVKINGLPVAQCYYEAFHEWRLVRRTDVADVLRAGENVIEAKITPLPGATEAAFLARLKIPGAADVVTDASWGGRELAGGLRAIDGGAGIVSREELVSPAFEKEFEVKDGVVRATLHVTAVGFCEATLNGRKIGDKVLDPSPTAYDKRVLYSSYELEGMLRPGRNRLALTLGHGWYDMRTLEAWNFDTAPWRDAPRAIAQLDITYADGTRARVATDGSWRQVQSPVLYDCLRQGEFSGAAARPFAGAPAAVVPGPKGRLVAENQPGSKVVRTIAPAAIEPRGEKTWLVRFDENCAGWLRVKLRGLKRGETVSFTYDERLGPDGALPTDRNWHLARDIWDHTPGSRRIDVFCICPQSYLLFPDLAMSHQRDYFFASGAGEETYEPRFMYHGYQYVTIRGLAEAPRPGDIVGCIVSTDFPDAGNFRCSDETLNQLMLFARRSYRANFVNGFPTDCPHREKNGWTGDASIASRLAQYMFENTSAYEKWLGDLCDAQNDAGALPGVVPTSGWGFHWGNGPVWDSALPFVAWNLYLYRGDRRALDTIAPALGRYVAFLEREKIQGGLIDWGLDDWIPPDEQLKPAREFVVSTYATRILGIAADIADLRGEAESAAHRRSLAAKIRMALRAKYLKGDGVWDNGGQTAQALALEFGLCDGEAETAAARARLVKAFAEADDHVTMGIVGMSHAFRALSSAGRTDLAFKVLTQPTAPSLGSLLAKGATSLWEDWEEGASRNHIMFGDFAAWAYERLAGIVPLEPGCRRLRIAPEQIAALSFVEASTETPYGTVKSAWRRTGGRVAYRVSVPSGTTAEFVFPGGERRELGVGEHEFAAPDAVE